VRILAFGTYDIRTHPRIGVLIEGLRSHGDEVVEVDVPLGLDTASRVAMLRQPWRLPRLAYRLARCWALLAVRGRRAWSRQRPDAVLVGYLGHFDVQLARLLFPRTPIVLDHLIFAADTAVDRGESGAWKARLLGALDRRAVASADLVVVDSDEHAALMPERYADRALVVPVGAPAAWFAAGDAAAAGSAAGDAAAVGSAAGDAGAAGPAARDAAAAGPATGDGPLRVVFFGLFTPLQGAPAIGAALGELAADPRIRVTMIGQGQDRAETRRLAAGNPRVDWRDWVSPAELPAVVAAHDVCLGIFGTGPKALRVVPNKVYQGAAAGCAVVTSDSRPQRAALGDAARFVPPGDAAALAAALRGLASDRTVLDKLRTAARDRARDRYGAHAVVGTLRSRMLGLQGRGNRSDPPTARSLPR
jgi:glycosyltransferase involved in cell wall biosynthesis